MEFEYICKKAESMFCCPHVVNKDGTISTFEKLDVLKNNKRVIVYNQHFTIYKEILIITFNRYLHLSDECDEYIDYYIDMFRRELPDILLNINHPIPNGRYYNYFDIKCKELVNKADPFKMVMNDDDTISQYYRIGALANNKSVLRDGNFKIENDCVVMTYHKYLFLSKSCIEIMNRKRNILIRGLVRK